MGTASCGSVLTILAFASALVGQDDPRIVTTKVPAECKAISHITLHHYPPNGLLQFLPVTVECVTPEGTTSQVLGSAIFCGAVDGGGEQKYTPVDLGVAASATNRALDLTPCGYPNEMRIVGQHQEAPAPESERIQRIREGLYTILLKRQPDWQVISDNGDIRVEVERQLYSPLRSFTFLIHVRVTGLTSGPLALALHERRFLVYPNGWQLHRANERPVIAEARASEALVDQQLASGMLQDYEAGRLTPLKGSVEYYTSYDGRPFNGGDYSGNERFLTVSTDGGVLFTDGRVVRFLSLVWRQGFGPRQTDLVIQIPLELKFPPPDAKIF
jgi:hypothetical protein